MQLKILSPTDVFLDEPVSKIIAEAEDGSFGLLPRHIDFVTSLAPGLLTYESEAGETVFVAVNGGILVKAGPEVLVSTRNANRHSDPAALRQLVDEEFQQLNERERKASTALAGLEANFVQRFMRLREGRYE